MLKRVTKKQQIESIIKNLQKGIEFIKREDVSIVIPMCPTGINKEIGSELCYLYNALRDLKTLQEGVKVERVA